MACITASIVVLRQDQEKNIFDFIMRKVILMFVFINPVYRDQFCADKNN